VLDGSQIAVLTVPMMVVLLHVLCQHSFVWRRRV
jgi:hypothetical protein